MPEILPNKSRQVFARCRIFGPRLFDTTLFWVMGLLLIDQDVVYHGRRLRALLHTGGAIYWSVEVRPKLVLV